MGEITVTRRFVATVDDVWDLIGGWNTLPAWHPDVVASDVEGDGLLRRVQLADATEILERLEAFDRAARSYTYIIVSSPLPLSSYRSRIHVEEATSGAPEAGVVASWSTEFTAVGVSDEEVSQMLRAFYGAGLDNAERLLSGR